MNSLSHVGDAVLRRDMVARFPNTRREIALTVAEVAEFDARKLYVPEGFPSMAEFCVSQLGFTRQSALKTIRVGRVARQFPQIFEALAEGRLNRSAVILLAPVLTQENATAVLAASARRSNDGIRELIAGYTPQLDTPLEVSARTPGSPVAPAGSEEGGWCPRGHHPPRWFQNHLPMSRRSRPTGSRRDSRWEVRPGRRSGSSRHCWAAGRTRRTSTRP